MIPIDGIVRDPDDLYLMSGIDAYGTPAYEGSDAQLYNEILREIATEQGFIHGENALAKAEIDLMQAERDFIVCTQSIHGISIEKLTLQKTWQCIIELLAAMFATVVENERLAQKLAAFFQIGKPSPFLANNRNCWLLYLKIIY